MFCAISKNVLSQKANPFVHDSFGLNGNVVSLIIYWCRLSLK